MTTSHRNVIVGDRNVTQTLTLLAIVGDNVSVGRELPQDNLQQLLGTLVTLLDAVDKGAIIPLHNTHTHIVTKVPSYLCTTHTHILLQRCRHTSAQHTHTHTLSQRCRHTSAQHTPTLPQSCCHTSVQHTHTHCHTSVQHKHTLSHPLMQLMKMLSHLCTTHIHIVTLIFLHNTHLYCHTP